MRGKLLSDEVVPACIYCERGILTATGQVVLCVHKGVCATDFFCRRFSYDPLRRKPRTEPVLPAYTKEEFEL